MMMKVKTYTFTTWCPTGDEFQQFCQILLSNQDHWYPYSDMFRISEMEEQRRYIVGRYQTPSRNIRFIDLKSNSLLPPVAQTQDDVNIHYVDQFNAVMGIKHTLFLSYSLQVNIKVPSSCWNMSRK